MHFTNYGLNLQKSHANCEVIPMSVTWALVCRAPITSIDVRKRHEHLIPPWGSGVKYASNTGHLLTCGSMHATVSPPKCKQLERVDHWHATWARNLWTRTPRANFCLIEWSRTHFFHPKDSFPKPQNHRKPRIWFTNLRRERAHTVPEGIQVQI